MKYFDGPIIGEEEFALVKEALTQGVISQNGFVKQFETDFAKYCGVKHALATSNGTTALHLALMGLDIKPGDEIIVPSYTFIASVNSISYCGAKPVFADCTLDTYNIDPEKVQKLVTPKTKAIMGVHLFGHPCDMDPLREIADKNGLYLIEDAAESHGAEYKDKKTGSLADIACFSFYSNKMITTGEGGMCLTNNDEIKERMGLLRAQGKELVSVLKERNLPQFYHTMIGYNYRLTDLQGALGVAQLKKLDSFIEQRRSVAKMYDEALQGTKVSAPVEKDWAKHVYWQYHVMFASKEDKEKAVKNLEAENIPCREPFYPCHKQPFYDSGLDLSNSMEVHERGLILPNSLSLTKEDIDKIVEVILR